MYGKKNGFLMTHHGTGLDIRGYLTGLGGCLKPYNTLIAPALSENTINTLLLLHMFAHISMVMFFMFMFPVYVRASVYVFMPGHAASMPLA